MSCLREVFSTDKCRPRRRDLPHLDEKLLAQARNCIVGTPENNDLLEFFGDRVLNLYTAELVERSKVSSAHHTVSVTTRRR